MSTHENSSPSSGATSSNLQMDSQEQPYQAADVRQYENAVAEMAEVYTFLTFDCFHFSVVSNKPPTADQEFNQRGSWGQALLDFYPGPTVKHTHIATRCPEPLCRDMTADDLADRARQVIQEIRLVLQIKGTRYLNTAQDYHDIPLSIRAALSETPQCALAHQQYGGTVTLAWGSDPFTVPFQQAVHHLKVAEALIEDNVMTNRISGYVLNEVNSARVKAGKFIENMTEVCEGVQLLLAYCSQHSRDESILDKERRPQVKASTGAIRAIWARRVDSD